MKILETIQKPSPSTTPISFAVGVFDGVHLGHTFMISQMKHHGDAYLALFSPTPDQILCRDTHIPQITSLSYRLELLKEQGVHATCITPFTEEMSHLTYDQYLREVHHILSFDHFFLGEGSTIGANREGTFDNIQKVGEKIGFAVHSVPSFTIDGDTVSSARIRNLLRRGRLKEAEKCLGRPFSLRLQLGCLVIDPQLVKPGSYQFVITLRGSHIQLEGTINKQGRISLQNPILDDPNEPILLTIQKD